jgi:hypothetical protein
MPVEMRGLWVDEHVLVITTAKNDIRVHLQRNRGQALVNATTCA